MKTNGRTCSRCQKFKSDEDFFRKGNRFESSCKACKRQARLARGSKSKPNCREPFAEPISPQAKAENIYGLSSKEVEELVSFFEELIILDRKECA